MSKCAAGRISVSLSLEVKKFVNTENTGAYVDILLPALEPVHAPKKVKTPKTIEAAAGVDASAPDSDAAGAPVPAQAVSAPETMRETMKLHYLEAGEGEPLILVHTVGQSLYTWRNVFDRLSAYYRVIAIDLPGHGYSSRAETFGYTVEDYAFALRAFMDEMHIQSAHFAAFSLGCAYVMRLAADAPSRIGRVVLLSPGGITPEMPLPIRLIDSPVLGFVASFLYNMGTVEKLLNNAVFDLTNITPDVVANYYRTVCDTQARRAIRMSLQYFDEEPTLNALREIDAPVLILQGSEDKWHPAQHSAETYHASLRNAVSAAVRNAGHLMHEEKADRVIAALLEFIPVVMPA